MRAHFIPLWLMMGILPAAAGGSLVFTDSSAWQASSPGNSSILDFESAATGYYSVFASDPFTFTADSGGEWIVSGVGGNYLTTDTSSVLDIALASGVYGVAFDLGSSSDSPVAATIVATDVNGVQYTTTDFETAGATGPAEFWGLETSVQLVNVQITFTGVLPQIDNVQYATNPLPPSDAEVPEPGTGLLILGCGLALWTSTSRSGGFRTRSAGKLPVAEWPLGSR